jgi:hypothetical protein
MGLDFEVLKPQSFYTVVARPARGQFAALRPKRRCLPNGIRLTITGKTQHSGATEDLGASGACIGIQ